MTVLERTVIILDVANPGRRRAGRRLSEKARISNRARDRPMGLQKYPLAGRCFHHRRGADPERPGTLFDMLHRLKNRRRSCRPPRHQPDRRRLLALQQVRRPGTVSSFEVKSARGPLLQRRFKVPETQRSEPAEPAAWQFAALSEQLVGPLRQPVKETMYVIAEAAERQLAVFSQDDQALL